MTTPDGYGYLLVHFVEDETGHSEKIFLSLSRGDDPLRWRRLGAVLESTRGTTGVRDPHIVRGPNGRFHLVATDLRVWRPEGQDWDLYRHRGSRDLVVWDSDDLLTWSDARFVTVAPEGAGMAWAPESVYDPVSGDFLVHWSSGLAEDGDPATGETGPSRILVARTKDFVTFTEPETYLELPGGVIDMTVLVLPDGVLRFAKHHDDAPGTLQVFQQNGSSFFASDFTTVARGIGQELGPMIEGPLVFPRHREARWYLWVDQYTLRPYGYQAYTSADPASGEWELVDGFELPEDTKHGAVLPLTRREYEALDARFPDPVR